MLLTSALMDPFILFFIQSQVLIISYLLLAFSFEPHSKVWQNSLLWPHYVQHAISYTKRKSVHEIYSFLSNILNWVLPFHVPSSYCILGISSYPLDLFQIRFDLFSLFFLSSCLDFQKIYGSFIILLYKVFVYILSDLLIQTI